MYTSDIMASSSEYNKVNSHEVIAEASVAIEKLLGRTSKPNIRFAIFEKNDFRPGKHIGYVTTMDYRALDINVVTFLKGLKLSKLFSKTRVVVSIMDDYLISRQETPVCTFKGNNPTWDYPMRFYLEDSKLQQDQLMVVFQIWCTPILLGGNQLIGEVYFSIKPLFDNWTKDHEQTKEGFYQVVAPSGKHRGCLVLKYNFGHDIIKGAPRKVDENTSIKTPWRIFGLSAPKSPPYNPAYNEATRRPSPSAPPYVE
ncbi:unnamed protein product [Dovyalis caffra]|uniref:C2 domain-containing protein n=1 Tax=Dovyalis caffra TaxID=77055 RepID=A0AAV1RVF3_9ROSI|nr:unnamed protein product [Dovyalis caffra]